MSFGYATATEDTWVTGMDDINALLSGTQWESNEVRYSFTSNFKYDYELSYPDSDSYKSSFKSLNEDQREAIYDWVAMYEDVSLLDMVELTGSENDKNATIRIAKSLETAHAYIPDDIRVEAGDIWFNHDDYEEPTLGNNTFVTFGHEIGHALGLEHGHEENGVSNVALNYYRDSMEFSIMTYRSYVGEQIDDEGYPNEDWGYAQSLMMYDIRAIQQMYGANFDTNSDDTIYRFSPSTYDRLTGGSGADNFVLGDSEKTYYQDFGYAIVTDFDYLEKDKFIASGSYSNYSLEYSDWIGGFALDTIVEYEGDVIAIVEDNTNVLMLDFTFV